MVLDLVKHFNVGTYFKNIELKEWTIDIKRPSNIAGLATKITPQLGFL